MKKVLITAVPKQDVSKPPGALSILAACCEQVEVEYSVLDLNLYMYKTLSPELVTKLDSDFECNSFRDSETKSAYLDICEKFSSYIEEQKFTHVAISVFTQQSILAVDTLLKTIKKSKYKCTIVIGGIGISSRDAVITNELCYGEYALATQLTDYAIFGEGEISFTEFLKDNYSYAGINQKNALQITELNELPIPSYKKINPYDYFIASEPEVVVTGSKGCIRDCTFCDVAVYWKKFIFKSGTRMARELFSIWKETGVRKFEFSDSLINGSMSAFREFNKELIKLKKENPKFNPSYKGQFICRPKNLMPESDYAEMVEAGAEVLTLGIESFSEHIRTHMRKKFNNASIDWHFEMSAKYGIKNVLLLISGYPSETIEDHNLNLEYLRKYQVYALARIIYVVSLEMGGLKLLYNTPLNDQDLGLDILQYENHNEPNHVSWISGNNLTLTPKERLRRSLEIVKVCYELGYKVNHLTQRIDYAVRQFENLNETKRIIKINSI
jgi:hypothetical protein